MNKYAILCVDDEELILNSLDMQLHESFKDKYIYEFAENANDALEILEELQQQKIPVVLIVSDWLMPGIKGDEFLIQAYEKYPKAVTIMLTGQADNNAIERTKRYANLYSCLNKPWSKQELIKTIEMGLSQIEKSDFNC